MGERAVIALVTSVFVASLVGSLHCAVMCGGLAGFYSAGASKRGKLAIVHAAYHAARLVAYASLGAAAGAAGSALDLAGMRAGIASLAAAAAFAVLLVWGGALIVQRGGSVFRRLRLPARLERAFADASRIAVSKPPTARAAILGLSSALLPCGWLYAFVLVAAGSGSAARGIGIMAAFWLGTVPALISVSLGARALAARFGRRLPVATAICLVAVGVTGVVTRMRVPIHDAASSGAASTGQAPEATDVCHGR